MIRHICITSVRLSLLTQFRINAPTVVRPQDTLCHCFYDYIFRIRALWNVLKQSDFGTDGTRKKHLKARFTMIFLCSAAVPSINAIGQPTSRGYRNKRGKQSFLHARHFVTQLQSSRLWLGVNIDRVRVGTGDESRSNRVSAPRATSLAPYQTT